jgi:hypothetical protein
VSIGGATTEFDILIIGGRPETQAQSWEVPSRIVESRYTNEGIFSIDAMDAVNS